MKILITIEAGKTTVEVDSQSGEAYTIQPKPQVLNKLPTAMPKNLEEANDPTHPGYSAPIRPDTQTLPPANAVSGKQDKICFVCGNVFTPPTKISRFCSKKCGTKHYNKQHRLKVQGKLPATSQPRGPEPEVPAEGKYCRWCKAFGLHGTGEHAGWAESQRSKLSDVPKPTPERRSKCCDAKTYVAGGDEGTNHYRCMGCQNACDTYEYIPPFEDPWDCDACRTAGTLCRLHQEMEINGNKPPNKEHVPTTQRRDFDDQ